MKRSYKQNCALAHALDMVGERWTLLLVRELLVAPRRYGELLENLAGIGTNLLASRLGQMTGQGLISREDSRYQLTQRGRELEPVVAALVRFGLTLEDAGQPENLSRPEWDVVALRALLSVNGSPDLKGKFQLDLDGHPFAIQATGGMPNITPGPCVAPRARVALDKDMAGKLLRGELGLDEALARGQIRVLGPRDQARKLLGAFGMQ